MKDILKGVTVKILSVIVMIALIVGGGCFAYKYYIGKALDAENDNAKNMYLDQARGAAYNISNIAEREKALREIESLR